MVDEVSEQQLGSTVGIQGSWRAQLTLVTPSGLHRASAGVDARVVHICMGEIDQFPQQFQLVGHLFVVSEMRMRLESFP